MDLIESGQGTVRHPWETTRYRFFRDLVTHVRDLGGARILDIGSGDAWFATRFAGEIKPRQLACVDANYGEADLARLRAEHPDVVFSAQPVEGKFDAIFMLDVAEHVQDDLQLLRDVVEGALSDDGLVVFSVPAGPKLWTSHDVALHHFRRYTPQQARTLLESAGLRILQSGSAYASLQVPRALSVLRERLFPRTVTPSATGAWNAPPVVTRLVEGALNADLAVCRLASKHEVPLSGLSFWALCERRR